MCPETKHYFYQAMRQEEGTVRVVVKSTRALQPAIRPRWRLNDTRSKFSVLNLAQTDENFLNPLCRSSSPRSDLSPEVLTVTPRPAYHYALHLVSPWYAHLSSLPMPIRSLQRLCLKRGTYAMPPYFITITLATSM